MLRKGVVNMIGDVDVLVVVSVVVGAPVVVPKHLAKNSNEILYNSSSRKVFTLKWTKITTRRKKKRLTANQDIR